MSDIYLQITETPTVVTLSAPVVSGALASTVTVANTVTVALDSNSLSALENVTVTVGAAITGTVTVSNFPASQAVTFSAVTISNFPSTQPVSIASVTIGSLPAISGTVTANLSLLASHGQTVTKANNQIQIIGGYAGGSPTNAVVYPIGIDSTGDIRVKVAWVGLSGDQTLQTSVTYPLPVQILGGAVTIGSLPALAAGTAQIGSVTASISNSVTIASLPAISGTVTANSSNGSLTTRFGSVTTANTAFATSAVTNADRKYLLIQNVTTASNVITVGIGFTPTTTQGIQLSAGAGLTFEGNYIPTGAVNLLSSVTASCFTILEG